MVFTCNSGLVYGNKVYLSKFRHKVSLIIHENNALSKIRLNGWLVQLISSSLFESIHYTHCRKELASRSIIKNGLKITVLSSLVKIIQYISKVVVIHVFLLTKLYGLVTVIVLWKRSASPFIFHFLSKFEDNCLIMCSVIEETKALASLKLLYPFLQYIY